MYIVEGQKIPGIRQALILLFRQPAVGSFDGKMENLPT